MASGLQQIVGIADGGPTAAMFAQQAAPDAPSGPASFLSALDQALAVQPPAADQAPVPQQAVAPDAAPAPAADAGQAAPTPEPAQSAGAGQASEDPQPANPRDAEDQDQAHSAKAKKGRTDNATESPATESPATESPDAQDLKQVLAENADVHLAGQKAAAASKQQTARPVQGRGTDARQADGQAHARTAQTTAAAQPAALSQVKTTAQNALTAPKGAADQTSGARTAAAQKGPGDASPAAVRYADAHQAQTAAATMTAPVQRAPAAQESAEDARQAAGRAKSARTQATESAGAAAGKAKAGQSGAAHAAEQAARSSTAAGAAAKATDAAAAAAVRGHGALTSQAEQQDTTGNSLTAWSRYNATAGEGYRQQVQALAGRSAGDMSAEIIRQSQYIRQNGDATMRLQLNPPEMGRIRLEVQMRSGELHVRMGVENPDVRDAMTRELPGLDRTLRDAQVEVQHIEVTDYQSGPQNGGRDASADAGPTGQTGGGLNVQGGQDSTSTGWARISASGSVDCMV